MTSIWATLLVATVGCYGLKLAGVSLPAPILNHVRVQQFAALLPVAMLTALVAIDLFDANGHYRVNWPVLAGVASGAIALRLGRALPIVLLVAVTTTAIIRLIS
jgi:branched-subunit amino acid transport protein